MEAQALDLGSSPNSKHILDNLASTTLAELTIVGKLLVCGIAEDRRMEEKHALLPSVLTAPAGAFRGITQRCF